MKQGYKYFFLVEMKYDGRTKYEEYDTTVGTYVNRTSTTHFLPGLSGITVQKCGQTPPPVVTESADIAEPVPTYETPLINPDIE